MPARKKSKRGAHFVGVGNPRPEAGDEAADADGESERCDASFIPPSQDSDDEMPADLEPEAVEPGQKRSSHRKAVVAAEGAAGERRLDAQAERQRRSRETRAEAKDRSRQGSVQDAMDGTLLAKKAAQELEPEDAWATPSVAVAEAVATDIDGERLVLLGEAAAAAAPSELSSEPAVASARCGRPPGSTTTRRSPDERYASHRGAAPGATANPSTSKAARRDARAAAAASPRAYAAADDAEPPAKGPRRADTDRVRGEQLLPKLKGELKHLSERLLQIASARTFQREDFIGGELLSREDWVEMRTSSWELRRVYAMAHAVALMQEGSGVVAACHAAAFAVRLGKKANGMTFTAVHSWLTQYIQNAGRIQPSRRGSNPNTESFLSDENIKENALIWLRKNVRSGQAKGSTEPLLNVPRSVAWPPHAHVRPPHPASIPFPPPLSPPLSLPPSPPSGS